MIEYRDYSIELGRWGSIPSQLLPLWAIKNGFSLDSVVKLYSVSFILLYYVFFLIVTVVLKNNKAGIALMLALCIGFRHAFYYSTAELYQGMALAFVLWALNDPEKEYNSTFKKWVGIILSLALIYIISYYHQLALFVVLFILIMLVLEWKSPAKMSLIIALSLAVFWFFIRFFILTDTNYERQKMLDFKTFSEQLPNIFELPSTLYFEQFVKDNFLSFSIIMAVVFFLFIKSKKWLLMSFFISFTLGYLLLILITYYRGESPVMYENYFVLIGCFFAVSLPFLLKSESKKYLTLIVIVPILLINSIGIFNGHYTMTKRIEYLERLIKQGRTFEKQKFLVDHRNFAWQFGWIKWAVPFETVLLSSLSSPDSSVTIFIPENMNQFDSLIDKENIFLGPDWAITWFGSQNLNKNYFHLPSSGYEKLSTYQNDSAFNEADFDKENMTLIPEKQLYYSDDDSFIVAEVNIINESGKKLPSILSGAKGVYLSYHIYDNKNNLILWDGIRTPLEVDIEKNYLQGLFVELPLRSGEYFVEVDFLTENVRWWGINSRFKLAVD